MKRLLLTGALLAATLAPVAAAAQDHRHDNRAHDNRAHGNRAHDNHAHGGRAHDNREWRHDRQDSHYDRRDLRQDRREFYRDRQVHRQETWQDYRSSHRDYYRPGRWNAPFRYRAFGVGAIIPGSYYNSRYYVNWQRYRLPPPPYAVFRYVRHYNDVLLINTRNGRVAQVYRNFYY